MFLVLIHSVAAVTDFTYDAIQNHIQKGEKAIYLLHITNNDYKDKTYSIESVDLNWVLEPRTIEIPARATEDIEITFTPFKDLVPKNYGINLKITSSTDRIEKFLPATLLTPDQILDVKLDTPEFIDTKKPVSIKLIIKNGYNIELNDLEVKLENEFIKESETIDIAKEQTRTDEFALTFGDTIKSGTYKLNVLIKDENTLYVDKDLEITIGVNKNLKEITEEKKSLLVKKEIIKKINEGNSDIKETHMKELSLAQRLFTKFEPEPDSIVSTNEKYLAQWNINISPGETLTITSTTNYRNPLLFAIIIIGLGYLLYSWQYRSLKVNKKVMTIHASKETIGAVKVLITLKNKGKFNLSRIKMIDRIPHLEHHPKHFIGLTPQVVKRGDGVTLTWDIPKIAKGEERIISYKIEDKIFVKRRIKLPGTYVKYSENNKIFRTKSLGSILKQL